MALSDTPPEDCLTPLYQLNVGKKAALKPYTFSCNIGDVDLEDGDVLVVGIGLEYISDGDGGEVLSYLPLETDIENGVATATFTPADYLEAKEAIRSAGDASRQTVEGLCLGLYYNHTYERSVDNSQPGCFRLIVSSSAIKNGLMNANIADGILTDLENAYDYYINEGYSFSARTRWPMDVKVQNLGEMSGAYVPIKTLQYSTISLNLFEFSMLADDIDAPRYYNTGDKYPLVVHEMGHFMQHCYTTLALNCIWTDEAASTYYEWKTGGPVNEVVDGNCFKTLDGAYPWASTIDHGYARMPLFQYLEEYVQPGFIHSLYTGTTVGYGTYIQWNDAITDICGDPSGYAADYYHKLLTGKLAFTYTARYVYGWLTGKDSSQVSQIGTAANLQLPAAETSLDALFPDGEEHLQLAEYDVTAYQYGPQFLALNISSGTLPDDTELWVYASGNCDVSAYCIKGSDITVINGDGAAVYLDDFSEKTADGYTYLIQLVGMHEGSTFSINNEDYTLCVMLYKSGGIQPTPSTSPDSTPDASAGVTDTESSPSPSAATIEDPCADAMPEVAGIQFDRFDDPTPNARSGSICQAPYMRIDAFNIIGGRLCDPDVSNNVNETFTYMNSGYCTAGETVGLQMIASARDREHDSIEYNILENQLTMTLRFYDEDGSIIGTPVEFSSPEDGLEHTIGSSISGVVPENAARVSIYGSFYHKYGSYGDYHSASVGIDIEYTVTDYDVSASAVLSDTIDTSSSAADDSDDEESEQFWTSMSGVWMCYNAVGEVEYFVFSGSGGQKSLTVGTMETERSEPSQAISVSKYDETTYEVIYRYDGVDYALYFEVSSLGDGTVYYAAYSPAGYRAFDYTGSTMSEAMTYYYTYYAAG